MIEEEIWRDIPGFPMYQASDWGRVRSWSKWKHGRLMSPELKADSYPCLMIMNEENKFYNRQVSDLVLSSFVGPRPPGYFICHKDRDTKNCRLDNLYYSARQRKWEAGKIRLDKIDRTQKILIWQAIVKRAIKLVESGVTQVEAGRRIGVTYSTMSRFCSGNRQPSKVQLGRRVLKQRE